MSNNVQSWGGIHVVQEYISGSATGSSHSWANGKNMLHLSYRDKAYAMTKPSTHSSMSQWMCMGLVPYNPLTMSMRSRQLILEWCVFLQIHYNGRYLKISMTRDNFHQCKGKLPRTRMLVVTLILLEGKRNIHRSIIACSSKNNSKNRT